MSTRPELILAPRKGIQGSFEFWIPRRGFRIQGTGFQSCRLNWILDSIVSGIPYSLSCIPYAKAQDSRFPETGAIFAPAMTALT